MRLILKISSIVFISILISSCANTVQNYDERLVKKYERKGFTSSTFESEETSLFYWDNENLGKPTIVFIHGFGGDGKISWYRQIKDLHDDYRIIVPDILWFGKSHSSKEPTLSAQITAMNSLFKHLKVSNLNVVGISYGGFITLGLAHKFPELISKIVIVNSPGAIISDEEVDKFCDKIGVRDIKEAFVPKTGSDVKRLLGFSFYKKPPIPNFLMDQILAQYFSQNPKEQKMLLDDLPSNRDSLSGGVRIPVEIIWGMEDEVFHVYDAYTLKDELDAELTVIKNAGHALPGEKPKKFNKVLTRIVE